MSSLSTKILGTVAMEPKGEYSSEAYYEKLNTVLYNDSTYMAIKPSHNILPTDTEYWQLIGGGAKKEEIVQVFDTVADMKLADLKTGMSVQTLGYYEVNDGGGATYKITDTESQSEYQEELDNELYASLIIEDAINVKQIGARGNNTNDDSSYFNKQTSFLNIPNGNYLLDKDTILPLKNKSCVGNGNVKFINYNANNNNGLIPIDKLDDEIYLSMNMPSDGITYMADRINGNFLNSISSNVKSIRSIGAIYKNTNENLPEDIYIYLGKMKLFGYNKVLKKWVILAESSVPRDVKLYALPWDSSNTKDVSREYENGLLKIKLKASDFTNTDTNVDGWVLHFWGFEYTFNSSDYNNIENIISCFECKAESPSGENITNKLLSVSAVDLIYNDNSINQLNYSKNYSINRELTKNWSHNILNDNYNTYVNKDEIEKIFEEEVFDYTKETRIIPPTNANKQNPHILIGSIDKVNENYMWSGKFDIYTMSGGSYYHNEIIAKFYRTLSNNTENITVNFYQLDTSHSLQDVLLIENDIDNNKLNFYINNIPRYAQVYCTYKPLIYTNEKAKFKINGNLMSRYVGYLAEYQELWSTETFTNTVYESN